MFNLKTSLVVHVCLCILCASGASAQMSSTNYRISSTNYNLMSTTGQSSPTGNISSASYSAGSGFWYTVLLAIIGDINGDGAVDLKDVIISLRIVTGQSVDKIVKQADMNGDGRIGIVEGVSILRQLGGL